MKLVDYVISIHILETNFFNGNSKEGSYVVTDVFSQHYHHRKNSPLRPIAFLRGFCKIYLLPVMFFQLKVLHLAALKPLFHLPGRRELGHTVSTCLELATIISIYRAGLCICCVNGYLPNRISVFTCSSYIPESHVPLTWPSTNRKERWRYSNLPSQGSFSQYLNRTLQRILNRMWILQEVITQFMKLLFEMLDRTG